MCPRAWREEGRLLWPGPLSSSSLIGWEGQGQDMENPAALLPSPDLVPAWESARPLQVGTGVHPSNTSQGDQGQCVKTVGSAGNEHRRQKRDKVRQTDTHTHTLVWRDNFQ